MAKAHPLPNASSSSYVTSSFTVWMKSLVMQGNGCTVFNKNGEVVYRIDNYDNRRSDEVYLMDLQGNVLFTILRRVKVFGRWRGYKGDNGSNLYSKKPSFQVTKKGEVTLLCDDNNDEAAVCYKLEASNGKSAFKIIDCRRGVVVAEATRKQSASGVLLGDDVLNLVVVESHVDRSFVIALVSVYGLMNHKL